MLLRLMKRSPWTTVYQENNPAAMGEYSRLRDADTIRELIRKEPRVFPVFKPLNDAQHALDQLALHPRSRGLWVYRECGDVVNSAVAKWGDAHSRFYGIIAGRPPVAGGPAHGDRDYDRAVAALLAEGMSDETRGHVRRLVGDGLTEHDGAALHWYCRNQLYFELELDSDPRVELVRYEDLVREPEVYVRRAFEFAGCRFRSRWAEDVFESSVGKQPTPPLSEPVRRLCDSMRQRLEAEYGRRLDAAASPTPD